jgi:hypothetical protein
MALCSLSMGRSTAPEERTASMSNGPAMTRDSLLASNSRLPARAAASVERKPAAPTIAAMTQSASRRVAISSSTLSPARTRVPGAELPRRSVRSRAAASFAKAAYGGCQRRICSASFATLRFAASATSRKRSGWRESTSSVLSPIEPVEPSTTTPIILHNRRLALATSGVYLGCDLREPSRRHASTSTDTSALARPTARDGSHMAEP